MRFREGSEEKREEGWILFVSRDIPAEELQRPIFISEEKLRGVWVMDMTTNAVLLPMMRSVCPSHPVSDESLPACLACLVVCLRITLSVCPSICLIVRQFDFQLVPMLFCTSVFMPVRSWRSTVCSSRLCQSTCRPNNGCNVRFPVQLDSFTWAIHLLVLNTIVSVCIPTRVLVLNVPPLCLRLGFTFVVSLKCLSWQIIWFFIMWDSFMSCPPACAIVMLVIHADNYPAAIISQMINNDIRLMEWRYIMCYCKPIGVYMGPETAPLLCFMRWREEGWGGELCNKIFCGLKSKERSMLWPLGRT